MVDRSSYELQALLFGEAPYERSSAPEPELIDDIAPLLDEKTLQAAFECVCHYLTFIDPGRRARLLAGLIPHIPLGSRNDALTQALSSCPETVDVLPDELIGDAILALRMNDEREENQAIALVALLARLPESEARQIRHDLLLELDDSLAESYDTRRAAIRLLESVSDPLPGELIERYLIAIEAIADPEPKVSLLMPIVSCLTDAQRAAVLPDLIEAVHALSKPLARANNLIALSAYIDEAQRMEILEESLALAKAEDEDNAQRMDLLARLSLYAPEPLKGEALDAAVEPYREKRIVWPSAEEALAEAFARMADAIPPALEQNYRQHIQALELPDWAYFDLLPYLSRKQLDKALERAMETSFGPGMSPDTYLLSRLAPLLNESQLNNAVQMAAVKCDEDESVAAGILMTLMPHLSAETLIEAANIAQKIPGRWWRGRTLGTLLKFLPEAAQRQFAVEEIFEVAAERIRQLLAERGGEERFELAVRLIESVEERYGGGAEAPPRQSEDAAQSAGEADGFGDVDPYSEEDYDYALDRAYDDDWRYKYFQEDESESEAVFDWHMTQAIERPFQREEKVVNTGFVSRHDPATAIDATTELRANKEYYFWLEVGARLAEAIDIEPTPLPTEYLPAEARLTVALFAFDNEIVVSPGADLGELQICGDDGVFVARPVVEPELLQDKTMLQRRLFFPVTMPSRAGHFRIRCNIYFEQVLIQSHLVEVKVVTSILSRLFTRLPMWLLRHKPQPVLQTLCDFTLSHRLDPALLNGLQSHCLSMMLNSNGEGNIGFRFFGQGDEAPYKQDAVITDGELQNLINKARGAMREAAWGDEGAWTEQQYRYSGPGDLQRLKIDLVKFAKWGYRFYDTLIDRLAGSGDRRVRRETVKQLKNMMAVPGMVQVASKISTRQVVPVAMIYDSPLETTLPVGDYQLCPEFLASLEQGRAFAESGCFHGACPSHDQDDVVCPSGFWGYRHAIGMPVSVGEHGEFAPNIQYDAFPELTMAVSTDPKFVLRLPHELALHRLLPNAQWHMADSRNEALELMDMEAAHVVYFYCHGGVVDDVPYLQVGPLNERGITRDVLRNKDIFWGDPQPLVFVNGCHTTALEPEKALDLVSGFIQTSNASGVIGTEITIFEPLACRFAEVCLEQFFAGIPIGEAVRRSRLQLLQDGNPLGLVYIPFVIASLVLQKT